jgi:tetratricopeptide (TPR) repeat protein
MADPVRAEPSPLPTASGPEFVATFATILVAIVALLFVDTWLARLDRDESRAHAANLYSDGQALLRARRPREASERFAAAVATDRGVALYELGLAEAMLDDGRPLEAERTLSTVLDRAQTDGRANLVMARVLVGERRVAEAKSFYHRAIYGRWAADSLQQRLQTRLELIRLLVREHAQQELLAELLPIQDATSDSTELQRTLGHLFIRTGSPARGVEIFRQVLQRSPDDGDAYAGMGEAALVLGNYRTARADFAAAARLAPDDTAITAGLSVADTALALDPMLRGIGARARAERGRRLLAMTLDLSARCTASTSPSAAVAADSARRLLASSDTLRGGDVDGDAFVSAATELWSSWSAPCAARLAGASATDQALRLVLRKLTA